MFLKRILAAGAFVVASAVAANAADIPPMTPPPPPPMAPPAPIFDWSRSLCRRLWRLPLRSRASSRPACRLATTSPAAASSPALRRKTGAVIGGGVGFEGNVNARVGALLGYKLLVYGEGGVGWVPHRSSPTISAAASRSPPAAQCRYSRRPRALVPSAAPAVRSRCRAASTGIRPTDPDRSRLHATQGPSAIS